MNKETNPNVNVPRLIIITVVILAVVLFCFLAILAKVNQTSFKRYGMNFILNTVLFHPNICRPYSFKYFNSTDIFIYAALLSGLILLVVDKLLQLVFARKPQYPFKPVLTAVMLSALILNIIASQGTRLSYWAALVKILFNKNTHERHKIMFKDRYIFPFECQQILKGYHQGEFVTDVDFKSSAEMTSHRMLSYYLYPAVSTRLDNNTPKDILIFYKKQNPLEHIPDGYSIKFSYLNNQYLLVQKNEAP